MPTFSPPTENTTPPVSEDLIERARNPIGYALMRHYQNRLCGRNVYIVDGTTVTEEEPTTIYAADGSIDTFPEERVTRFFQYPGPYEVTSVEATLLDTAGFTVHANGVTLDGSTGTSVSSPDSARLSLTAGDFALITCIALDDYTPTSQQAILTHFGSPGNRSWEFFIITSGALRLNTSTGGTTMDTHTGGAPSSVVADGSPVHLAAIFDADGNTTTNRVKFYYSLGATTADPLTLTWTQLGSDVNGTQLGALFDSTAAVHFGKRVAEDTNMIGTGYYIRIYEGPASVASGVLDVSGATRVASPDFRSGGDFEFDSTTGTDDEGNVWTLNGSAELA